MFSFQRFSRFFVITTFIGVTYLIGNKTVQAFKGKGPLIAHNVFNVSLTYSDTPSLTLSRNYDTTLTFLREAVWGFPTTSQGTSNVPNTNGILQTNVFDTSGNIVILNINIPSSTPGYPARTVSFYISPANLYLLGFANSSGNIYAFSDQVDNLNTRYPGHTISSLGYGSSYGSIGDTRATTLFTHQGILTSLLNLSRYQSGNDVSGDLIRMTQWISEAMRFRRIQRTMSELMRNSGQGSILNPTEIALENNWGFVSTQVINANSNGSFQTPAQINNTLTINSVNQALQYITMMNGS